MTLFLEYMPVFVTKPHEHSPDSRVACWLTFSQCTRAFFYLQRGRRPNIDPATISTRRQLLLFCDVPCCCVRCAQSGERQRAGGGPCGRRRLRRKQPEMPVAFQGRLPHAGHPCQLRRGELGRVHSRAFRKRLRNISRIDRGRTHRREGRRRKGGVSEGVD